MEINNLKLNFQDQYYMFYDWLETDDIDSNNTVLLYRVSSKIMDDLLCNKIKLSDLSVTNKYNIILFSDGFSFVAIEFNEEGISEFKSSLLLEDEFKISNKVDDMKCKSLSYTIISQDKNTKDLRCNEEIKNTIRIEIQNLKQSNNIDKLEYLYYEWFQKKENNLNKMINNMNKRLNKSLTKEDRKIYNLIKLSYKAV